jgi:phosphoribosylanthranilate isomerase
MRVKICGITNIEDALCAVDAGADALGFVFYEKSPRFITFEQCRKIIDSLPPFVERVGLFVEATAGEIEDGFKKSGISLAQIHFDVNDEFLQSLSVPTLPVIRAKSKEDLTKFKDRYKIVDAFTADYGGSGKRLNLEWFDEVESSKIIVAGGLNPNNLDELRGYPFYGVDVSSGVELKKGKKDCQKVRRFIQNAKTL